MQTITKDSLYCPNQGFKANLHQIFQSFKGLLHQISNPRDVSNMYNTTKEKDDEMDVGITIIVDIMISGNNIEERGQKNQQKWHGWGLNSGRGDHSNVTIVKNIDIKQRIVISRR